MSFLDQVAVLILTKNEEANIARTLGALSRFPLVMVLDSGSDDATRAIVESTPNAQFATRAFDSHAAQWNHGLSLIPSAYPWTLALDADYVLTDSVVSEIAALSPDASIAGFRASFRYCVHGKPLTGSLYPPVTVLFRRDRGRYDQHGHTQRLEIEGAIAALAGPIMHDDRKPLSRWLLAQSSYARLEADYLLSTPRSDLRAMDRLRIRGWSAPLLVLPYTLIIKRCLFDGWRGWFYALQRLAAESMIALAVMDRRNSTRRHEDK